MNIIDKINDELKGNVIELKSLKKENTAIVVVDMVNGFVKEGVMSSQRVDDSITKNIVELIEKTFGYKKVYFIDSHEQEAIEFNSYPPHCVKGSSEAKIIDELHSISSKEKEVAYIEKNSTNGFLDKKFQQWLEKNIDTIENYIVVGCVTDICVLQFSLSLKVYFNEINKFKRVIVPMNCVETYDLGSHDGDLMNMFALYNMKINGIEVVDKVN